MSQEFATAFYHSPQWLKNRKNYLMRTLETPFGTIPPGMCEICFRHGDLVPAKVVHHKVHLTPENINDPHYTLAYENLQRLCQDCHALVHSGQPQQRVAFDENGRLLPVERKELDFSCAEEPDRNIYRDPRKMRANG